MVQRGTHLSEDARSTTADTGTLLHLLRRLTEQLSTLFRQEVKLAAAEISGSLTAMFLSMTSVASGAAVLYAGFILLLFAAVLGLAHVVPMWLASLSVGLGVALMGWLLMAVGKQKLNASGLAPTHSPESLRRDKDLLTRKVS